jgi:PAS domain S-box-containing protein
MDELELRLDGGLEVRMLKRSVSCSPSIVALDPALGHAAGTRQRVRTQSFLEEIGEAFFALDWEYRYIHANRLGLRLTGKSLEHLRGHTPWELFPGLEDSPLQSAYREAMEVGRPAVLEHRSLVTGDWLEVRIYPTGVGVSAYYREINERKAAEEELRRYRLLAEQARDIMLFVRYADGRILEANVAAEKAYGYPREELLGLSIAELRAPETSPSVHDQMTAASEDGLLFETLHRRADGSVFPVEVSSQGTTDIDGERVLLSIVRDVSERQSAAAEVHESEQRYRSLFENMIDGYAYCRMLYEDEAPVDFVYLDVNSAFERLTGLKGAVGRKVSEIIPGVRQDNPELLEIYGRVARGGGPESFET